MGNAFAVYLISHYDEIYVIDFPYSKHNLLQIMEGGDVDDLIFAMGMYGAMGNASIGMMRNLAKHPRLENGNLPWTINKPSAVDTLNERVGTIDLNNLHSTTEDTLVQ